MEIEEIVEYINFITPPLALQDKRKPCLLTGILLSIKDHIFDVCHNNLHTLVCLDHFADFVSCVDDGCVISATKYSAYCHQWQTKHFGDEIDGNHTWLDNILCFLL